METDGTGTTEKVVVTVTDETKRIANGIEARAIRDVVSEMAGPSRSPTTGTRRTRTGTSGISARPSRTTRTAHSSRAGSFVAGVDGAQAGIAMPANPEPLMTRDLVPAEPKVQELKFYARGVGPLLSMHTDGAGARATLVAYTPGP